MGLVARIACNSVCVGPGQTPNAKVVSTMWLGLALLDWIIIVIALLGIAVLGIAMSRLVKDQTDFSWVVGGSALSLGRPSRRPHNRGTVAHSADDICRRN